MSRTIRIMIACFVGAFMGSAIALQLGRISWFLGALAGAFIAYLGYDFEAVMAAIPVAYEEATEWKPDYDWWRSYRSYLRACFYMTANTMVLYMTTMCCFFRPIMKRSERLMGCIVIGIICGAVCFFMLMAQAFSGFSWEQDRLEGHDQVLHPLSSNPLKFLFWFVPRGIVLGIKLLPSMIYWAVKTVATFVRKFSVSLFRIIHSEFRLLCAVDAALGTAIGYFAGNPLIGGIAGGVLGVLNYEIISVRMMKVAGAKSFIR